MSEDIKVEETTEQLDTVEKKEETMDYAKELEEAELEKARNNIAAQQRIERKNAQVEEETVDNSDLIAEKVIQKVLPVLNSATQSNLIESKLDNLSDGNDALKRLIKFHMDNSVNPSLDLNERIEAAYAIANKKVIDKKVREINIAQKNRMQIANVGQGSSTETHEIPGSNALSPAQKAALKEKADQFGKIAGWNDSQKKKFIEDAEKRLAMAK